MIDDPWLFLTRKMYKTRLLHEAVIVSFAKILTYDGNCEFVLHIAQCQVVYDSLRG